MPIKTIPLSRLEADPRGTLNECVESGQPMVIELPGQRFVAIQPLDPTGDDELTNDLLAGSAAFRAMVERSKASPRHPFVPGRSR